MFVPLIHSDFIQIEEMLTQTTEWTGLQEILEKPFLLVYHLAIWFTIVQNISILLELGANMKYS